MTRLLEQQILGLSLGLSYGFLLSKCSPCKNHHQNYTFLDKLVKTLCKQNTTSPLTTFPR